MASQERDISVLIADDHPIFRQGLAFVLEREPGVKVLGEAENGLKALELIESADPDIVILDIDMPVLDGVQAAREIQNRKLRSRPIFLSMHKDMLILKSLRSLGVAGYVLKDSAMEEIVASIKAVAAGNVYLSPALNELMLDSIGPSSEDTNFSVWDSLTQTEKKILYLITESKTNRQMADELFVTVRTIETHRYNICRKLELSGAHSLVRFAAQNKERIRKLVKNQVVSRR
ncbi:MAG TPA: response regulator transcription factor [Pyrinomonadaceae bacterium]|nr:response regulator transcription factor [Pyrinomonadaceae bacterium]